MKVKYFFLIHMIEEYYHYLQKFIKYYKRPFTTKRSGISRYNTQQMQTKISNSSRTHETLFTFSFNVVKKLVNVNRIFARTILTLQLLKHSLSRITITYFTTFISFGMGSASFHDLQYYVIIENTQHLVYKLKIK